MKMLSVAVAMVAAVASAADPLKNGTRFAMKDVPEELIVYTVGEAKSPIYPKIAVNRLLKAECAKRGIVITDWHLHIRGGMTPEMALERELDSGIRSTVMENHGREWEIYDDAKLVAFAKRSRAVNPKMPVGIQVNDRDWFAKISPETRAQFDYILADTMIMGNLPSGRDNRLWMVKEIPDPEKWMDEYFAHTMRILDEPISILANPTYLPEPLAGDYDRLWTEERMRSVIAKAVEKGVALEIQAESPYPRPKFLKLAKEMGAKFSFGTNNFDPTPKDLSRWLEVITWLDLKPSDIWEKNEDIIPCHRNICRSPMAEFVMKDLVNKAGRDDIVVESAAMHTDEIGNDIHYGTRQKLIEMNVPFTPRAAWLLTAAKAREYDLLIGMDSYNTADLKRLVYPEDRGKIRRMLEFANINRDVADPWYTGNFDATYDDILAGCTALLASLP